MNPLYTAQQSRVIDQKLIERLPIDGYQLMRRAGESCYRHLMAYWPKTQKVMIYAGSGNNGGDAYIIGRFLREAGVWVRVVPIGEPQSLRDDAAQAYTDYINSGGELMEAAAARTVDVDVLVDGVFGTGLSRLLSNDLRTVVEDINKAHAKRFAIDIQSGLNADTGCPMPVAVDSDLTVSFITRKQGLYTGAAKDFCGELVFDDLQTQTGDFGDLSSWLVGYYDCGHLFTPRKADTHKNIFGRLLIVGGDYGMVGAVCLAGLAALRAGAGLVTCATRPEHAKGIAGSYPELMTCGVSDADDLDSSLQSATAVVLGPGLGRSAWSESLFDKVSEHNLPVIADADALQILARKNKPLELKRWMLTPHPGEAAALLGISTAQVQADRFAALTELHSHYVATPVLKGAGTLIFAGGKMMICSGGNPGMSTAGMGDVLSGVAGGLLAQGMSLDDAAVASVCVHAEAGDRAAGNIPRGLVASDLLPLIRECVNFSVNGQG